MTSNPRRRRALGSVAAAAVASVALATACTAPGSDSARSQSGTAALTGNTVRVQSSVAPSAASTPDAPRSVSTPSSTPAAAAQTDESSGTDATTQALAATTTSTQAESTTASARTEGKRTQRSERPRRHKHRHRGVANRPIAPAPMASVSATPSESPAASTTPSQSQLPAAAPSQVAALPAPAATASETASETPTVSPSTAPTPLDTTPGSVPELDLPRIPWEGGPQYWSKFRNANKAGWTDPNFFPVAVWWNGISTDEEVQYDKSLGLNTYVEMDAGTDYKLLERNDAYWVGPKLNDTFTDESTNWVGNFMDDEPDGRFEPSEGLRRMREAQAKGDASPRFDYANFTQMMVNSYFDKKHSEAYLQTTDVASLDMYWYTIPFCNWDDYNENYYIFKLPQQNCRTSASYGKMVEAMRVRDAADGKLQPLWNFVELSDPVLPGVKSYGPIRPEQLKGAAMSSVINEARGLIYYNQDHGECESGTIVRKSQFDKNYCASAQVKAMGEVNNFVHKLAPVINTQSYKWDFGKNLDTMLKSKDGNAYIFAMVDGGGAGSRTFTLPAELKGKKIEVVDENRTITPNADGSFSDDFAAEYTYHVYKLS